MVDPQRETYLVILLLAMALLAPPILEFIFKQSCARVISLHNLALLAWMHWVARPFFFNICRTLSSFISKLPFSVSQILLRSAVMKNRTLISSALDLMRISCWSDVNRGIFCHSKTPKRTFFNTQAEAFSKNIYMIQAKNVRKCPACKHSKALDQRSVLNHFSYIWFFQNFFFLFLFAWLSYPINCLATWQIYINFKAI